MRTPSRFEAAGSRRPALPSLFHRCSGSGDIGAPVPAASLITTHYRRTRSIAPHLRRTR